MTAKDRVLGLTSLSFDIAVLELWLPLTIGRASGAGGSCGRA